MHKKTQYLTVFSILAGLTSAGPAGAEEASFYEAVSGGKASVNFNARYEAVDQDNALEDASALTLRTRLSYLSGAFKGFSALLEVEDSRIVGGQNEYTVGPTGFNPGQYSVIADPETTEFDQGFLQYKADDANVTVKLGRQVITYDGHRFVGHVGWRQDRQTFDALTVKYSPLKDLALNFGFVTKRNRIFAEDADIDSKDHLLNASYKTPIGTLGGYAYLLEVDNGFDNGLDTYGVSFKGSKSVDSISLLYALEFATQDSSAGTASFDADYLLLEAGVSLSGVSVKLGYEVLGSDGGSYGFSTPLATLHKFNGWSDQFLGTPAEGLEDVYVSVNGEAAGINWVLVYHDFSADESSLTTDDFGSEIDVQLTKKFAGKYTVGLKYAAYDASDASAGKVDTNKLWAWFTMGF